MNKIFASLIAFAGFICIMTLTGPGCANIIPPTGGPRDSLPPVLVSAVPKDSSLNFKDYRITLTFDEYVQLDNNLNEQLIVSPNPEKTPVVEGKLRTVNIRIKDSLKPNTTYSFNFGNAIKDVNENNPYRNFTYVFSTGDKLADGVLNGNVKVAETGDADSTLLVMLHLNTNDTAIKKLRADYYTRLDSTGNFHFRFLPNEKFSIYVLPNDYSKKYDDSTKIFAFYNEPVEAGTNPSNIQLYAYQEFLPKPIAATTAASGGSNANKDEKEEDKRLKYTASLDNGEQDLLDSLKFNFNRKVVKFDSSLLALSDTNYVAAQNYRVVQADTTGKKFALVYPWKENQYFKLIIQKAAFTDSAGISLPKIDTIAFKSKRESQYGSIRLHFNNLDLARNPVLQLVQNKTVVQSIVMGTNEWFQRLFKPGQYDMRILYDTNKNGVWDPGSFEQKRQPEVAEKIKRPLITKANLDNEIDINL